MKHRVDELEDSLLDAAVAQAEGLYFELRNGRCGVSKDAGDPLERRFEPSSNWEQGGPIIERERIVIAWENGEPWAAVYGPGMQVRRTFGPTPLVAAMRAFVRYKLGEDVELP